MKYYIGFNNQYNEFQVSLLLLSKSKILHRKKLIFTLSFLCLVEEQVNQLPSCEHCVL